MNLNIRITRREGDAEETIEIGAPRQPVAALAIAIDGAPIRNTVDRIVADAKVTTERLEWSPTLCDGERVNYAKAEEAVAALNASLSPGEPQFRIPTREELQSILDLSRHDPAVDTERFPDTKSAAYWTSTPCAWAPSYAWVVYFDGGYVGDFHRGNFAFVRAVRVASSPAGQ